MYIQSFSNEIELIIDFVDYEKTRFVVNMFQSLLFNLFIVGKKKQREKKSETIKQLQIHHSRILICISNNATINYLTFCLR